MTTGDLPRARKGSRVDSAALAPGTPNANAHDAAGTLDEVRDLLGRGELERIERLERRGISSEAVASVLPDAILRREAEDGRVAAALEETIESGLFQSARKDPQALADAIHPALGPAIRAMIQSSLKKSLESLNVALENALSPQGIRWRVQAARTGKSFSEVVLLNTLLYRVEQVMLVHTESGLVIQEVHASDAPTRDVDMVAGMLSAIRDFASDSFGHAGDRGLEEIEFAGLTLIMAQGPGAVLALVVQGNPPRDLHERAFEAGETLHVDYGHELASFDGDSTALAGTRPILEELLRSEVRERRPNPLVRAIPIVLAMVAAAFLAWWFMRGRAASHDLARVQSALERTTGVVITSTEIAGGTIRIEGLVDPLVGDPMGIARGALRPSERELELDLRPFASLEPKFVLERARRALVPPAVAKFTLEGSTLIVAGIEGDSDAAADIRSRAPLLPGIDAVTITP